MKHRNHKVIRSNKLKQDRRNFLKLSGKAALAMTAALPANLWLHGCGKWKSKKPPNVIFIIIDTLRADRLGCYGSRAGLTPEIDKFAQQAIQFENAFSHAPWTLPSIASLFTSQYPVQHSAGGRLGSFTMLPDKSVSIAELFQQAGVLTGAITNVTFLTNKFGMTQGFDIIDATIPENNILSRQAEQTTRAASQWFDKYAKDRFFLFVHYFDPHLIYDPPQPFRKRFADPFDANSNENIFGTGNDIIGFRLGKKRLFQDQIGRLEKLYNGEVAYVDHEVGKLLSGISQRGLDEDTIILITSDHGEEFGDHGGFEHGHTLYNELLHVPMIMRVPGLSEIKNRNDQTGSASIPTTVRQIDIAPTICELATISTDPGFSGSSLVELLKGKQTENRPVISQSNMWGLPLISIRKDKYKLIQSLVSEFCLLFDSNADPLEQHNLAGRKPEVVKKMKKELKEMLISIASKGNKGQEVKLSDSELKVLKSLGYLK